MLIGSESLGSATFRRFDKGLNTRKWGSLGTISWTTYLENQEELKQIKILKPEKRETLSFLNRQKQKILVPMAIVGVLVISVFQEHLERGTNQSLTKYHVGSNHRASNFWAASHYLFKIQEK